MAVDLSPSPLAVPSASGVPGIAHRRASATSFAALIEPSPTAAATRPSVAAIGTGLPGKVPLSDLVADATPSRGIASGTVRPTSLATAEDMADAPSPPRVAKLVGAPDPNLAETRIASVSPTIGAVAPEQIGTEAIARPPSNPETPGPMNGKGVAPATRRSPPTDVRGAGSRKAISAVAREPRPSRTHDAAAETGAPVSAPTPPQAASKMTESGETGAPVSALTPPAAPNAPPLGQASPKPMSVGPADDPGRSASDGSSALATRVPEMPAVAVAPAGRTVRQGIVPDAKVNDEAGASAEAVSATPPLANHHGPREADHTDRPVPDTAARQARSALALAATASADDSPPPPGMPSPSSAGVATRGVPVARPAPPGSGAIAGSTPPGAPKGREERPDAASPDASVTLAAPTPPPVRGTPEPAGRVFAAAMHLAATGEDRRSRADGTATAVLGIAAPDFTRDTAVAAASAPAIDLTDGRWPARMLERIESLRDDADAASTRVRFAPDALGPVEVHLRHQDGATHLHFTAAQADTRALLQAAQPELALLASERGVKLGQSSVGGGDAQPQRQPAAPARFAAPPRATPDMDDADTNTRIA